MILPPATQRHSSVLAPAWLARASRHCFISCQPLFTRNDEAQLLFGSQILSSLAEIIFGTRHEIGRQVWRAAELGGASRDGRLA